MFFQDWYHEQVSPGAVAGSGGRWASPASTGTKKVAAPARRALSGRLQWVPVSGRCLYTSVCGREGIRLVYSLQTLDCPKQLGWSGLWCPLQNPAHSQQTPDSCWSLTWSLDFKVWLTTQFHGLQLFIYSLLYCSQLCCDVPSCRVKHKSWSKYKLSELCWQTEPPRRCLLIPDWSWLTFLITSLEVWPRLHKHS